MKTKLNFSFWFFGNLFTQQRFWNDREKKYDSTLHFSLWITMIKMLWRTLIWVCSAKIRLEKSRQYYFKNLFILFNLKTLMIVVIVHATVFSLLSYIHASSLSLCVTWYQKTKLFNFFLFSVLVLKSIVKLQTECWTEKSIFKTLKPFKCMLKYWTIWKKPNNNPAKEN